MYYWNIFACPTQVDHNDFIFLTDRKIILSVKDDIFNMVQTKPQLNMWETDTKLRIPLQKLEDLIESGLIVTEHPWEQFIRAFASSFSDKMELLHIITSYLCNLKCSYCFMLSSSAKHSRKVLKFQEAKKAIDLYFSLQHEDASIIHFYGGEPLLHPELIRKCMRYIYSNYTTRAIPKIITNGTLYDSKILDLLVSFPFDISVSLDGDQEANDHFRLDHSGQSTFKKVIEGIKTFQKKGLNPKILVTVGNHNIRRLSEVVEFILSLEPQAIALNFPRALPQRNHGLENSSVSTEYWIAQYERCLNLCYSHGIPELYFADMLWAFLSGKARLRSCAACGAQISVGPGETIGPCQAFVATGEFTESFDSFDRSCQVGVFARWKSLNKASSLKCLRCSIAPICCSDCYFDRYNRTGILDEPLSFHCKLRRAMVAMLVKRIVRGQSIGFKCDFRLGEMENRS
jgi:uncharacterized protein